MTTRCKNADGSGQSISRDVRMKNYLIASFAFGLLSSFPVIASTTYMLRIDAASSSLSYSDASRYGISGLFKMVVLDASAGTVADGIYFPDGSGNMRLVDVSVTTDPLPDTALSFPAYYAELAGGNIRGDANYCGWPGTPGGTCLSAGASDSFGGTFDGQLLSLTGVDYLGLHRSPNHTFRIAAQVVPLPGTSLLFLGGSLGGIAVVRRGC